MEEFAGGEGSLLVAEVKVAVGQGALAVRGDEGEFGVVDEECGGRVGGGTGVDDVAADGGAVLVGDAAGPTGGLGEEGKTLCDGGVVAYVGEGGSGADDDGVGCVFDEAELFEVPEGDELAGLEVAGAEGNHEFGASGDGGVVVRGVGEDLQDRVEGCGGDEVVLGGCSRCSGRGFR